MMRPYSRVLDILGAASSPVLVFVGPACRSWYVDREALEQLMVDLYATAPYSVVHGGRLPFDGFVEATATALGAPVSLVGPDFEHRFTREYTREPGIVLGATLLVAFPAEDADGKAKYPTESADLGVVRQAQEEGIPILVVRRNGKVELEE